jgi:hypothetical protein
MNRAEAPERSDSISYARSSVLGMTQKSRRTVEVTPSGRRDLRTSGLLRRDPDFGPDCVSGPIRGLSYISYIPVPT